MHRYAIALGSNRRHGCHGAPACVIEAALATMAAEMRLVARSRIFATPALGPAGRGFANAAALVETPLDPPALLARLKAIERAFGRRRGRRWGARVLDLDLILWSAGCWSSGRPALHIPHAALPARRFVLDPLVEIAADWPVSDGSLRVRHRHARLTAARPLSRG